MTPRHFLALEMAGFVALNSGVPMPTVMGVVAVAERAHLNASAVSEGTTVYDGDRLSTEPGGMLRLRGEGAALDLGEESTVVVRGKENGAQGTEVELSRGTLLFSTMHAGALEITARGAHVGPIADARTAAQVSITGPKELCIYARRGSLQLSYREESETIAEGTAYRVILDPADDDVQKKEPVKQRRRKAFLLIAIAGGAAGGAAALLTHENHGHRQMESPDRP